MKFTHNTHETPKEPIETFGDLQYGVLYRYSNSPKDPFRLVVIRV